MHCFKLLENFKKNDIKFNKECYHSLFLNLKVLSLGDILYCLYFISGTVFKINFKKLIKYDSTFKCSNINILGKLFLSISLKLFYLFFYLKEYTSSSFVLLSFYKFFFYNLFEIGSLRYKINNKFLNFRLKKTVKLYINRIKIHRY
ncbi:hypothetical protein [Guillardia theta]|uniref:Uncharacterized protein n=1 Tax=Guillardia theta TaxID=55529 RepID=Q9AW60_GUITH|nr:hypothetical protein GTHECHR2147 [Guillardia theta]CAC27010.1 hypothetical protein [Guillardia theta]